MRFLPNILFLLFATTFAQNKTSGNDNPNVWNFSIARKVIAAFQFNGMGMSIWEDQGVENTTIVSRRQFYVTPITEFLPNATKCEYNILTGASFVSYNIQVWNDRLQLAAIDRLKQMDIVISAEQMQPLPFYQVRVIWNSAQQKLLKASLSTTWNNNLQQRSIHEFIIIVDDKETCEVISNTLQTEPKLFTNLIALEYSLSAATTSTRTLAVKTDHFLNSQLMATLKTMDVRSPERYLTSDDANRLGMEIMDNVVATQVVDGEYVPDVDQLTLKDIVTSSLQLVNVDVGNFSAKLWESVFWDPVYARPDTVSSYLNKVLTIDQGKHTVNQSSAYSEKGSGGVDFGIGKLFSFGGKGGKESAKSASFDELNEWLHQHNYDVEIQGQIFIPKNLNLKRLNLGVLDRQETIFTKSVQMHHVDAPGTLKVTIGEKSIVENEDIKMLRQNADAVVARLNSLEPRVGGLEPRVGGLEPRVGQLEPQMANTIAQAGQLGARIEQVAASLTGTIGSKLSSCKLCIYDNGRVSGCSGMSDQSWPTCVGGGCLQYVQNRYMTVQCNP
jgi:hypothetical protein